MQTLIITLLKNVNIVNMIIPINWLNYFVAIYRYMKMTYRNHDMEDYIDYHDIRYILHITNFNTVFAFCGILDQKPAIPGELEFIVNFFV